MDVERHHHVPLHRHCRVGDEPVAANLGDEAPQPRTEVDALRVELDRREVGVGRPALLVVEGLLPGVLLHVADRVGEDPGRRPAHLRLRRCRASGRRRCWLPGGAATRARLPRWHHPPRRRRLGTLARTGVVGVDLLRRVAARERHRVLRIRPRVPLRRRGDRGPTVRRAAAAATFISTFGSMNTKRGFSCCSTTCCCLEFLEPPRLGFLHPGKFRPRRGPG